MKALQLFINQPLKLILPILLAIMIIALSAIAYLSARQEIIPERLEDAFEQAQQSMQVLQYGIDATMRSGHAEVAAGLLELGGGNQMLEFGLLADKRGHILAATKQAWIGLTTRELANQGIMQVDKAAPDKGQITASEDKRALIARYPVIIERLQGVLRPQRDGLLYVRFNLTQPVAEAEYQVRHQTLLVMALIMLLLVPVWLMLHFGFARRIEKLEEASRNLGAGDMHSRVDLPGNDELARLGKAFDEMAEQLAAKEEQLTHILRLRTMANAVNKALVHTRDNRQLRQMVCDALVQRGDYRLVWVGVARHDEEKRIDPLAKAGLHADCLEKVKIGWGDNDIGQGPSGRAIREGATQIVQDVFADPSFEPWRKLAEECGFRSVISLPLKSMETSHGLLVVHSERSDAFDDDEVRLLEEMADDLAYGLSMLHVRVERDDARHELGDALMQTIEAISLTVEKRDPYTAGHQHRVALLARAIARQMGLPEEQVTGIHFGAMIHDIGKISMPSEILSRPGRLTETEMALISTHSQAGYEIVKGVRFPWPVASMIRQHHERMDGSGYPQGLKGDDICAEARVLAVADVVEAMASHRPYRPALGIDVALQEIESGRGSLYDADAVDACLHVIRQQGFIWPDS